MVTGLGYFQRSVELCRQAGLARLEIPLEDMIREMVDADLERHTNPSGH